MSYLTENENRLGLFVFLLSMLVYSLTLCPTVSSGDSGELITAVHTLGIPHSPGYPLFCLLGKLFTFIPIGSIAFRVNLMSALLASLAVTIIYFIIITFIKIISPGAILANKFLPALSASLIFAFSNTFWSQAVISEVYTLFIFTITLTFFILIKWTQERKNVFLYLFSFLYGVSVTCHQLALFFAPGFFLAILLYEPKLFLRYKVVLGMFLLFILGLCLYFYVPIRAFSGPALNWNKVHDVRSFLSYILRKQYGSVKNNYDVSWLFSGFPTMQLASVLNNLWRQMFKEFNFTFIISGFGILFALFKARRYLVIFLTIFYFACFRVWWIARVFRTEKSIYIGRIYLLSGYLILVIFIGLGLFYLLDFTYRKTKKLFYYFTLLAICMLVTIPLLSNYNENDKSRSFLAYDFGRNILDTLDKDAILLGEGDNTLFILAYLTIVEKLRPDVTIYDDIGGDVFKATPFVLVNLNVKEKNELIDFILKKSKRPLYISFSNTLIATTNHRRELIGIVYRVLRDGEFVSIEQKEKCWRNYRLRDVFDTSLENKDFLDSDILSSYYVALGTYLMPLNKPFAIELYRTAGEIAKNVEFINQTLAMYYSYYGMYKEAISAMENAIKHAPDDPEVYYNLGVTYAKAEKYSEAISAWKKALEINPDFGNIKEYTDKAEELLNKKNIPDTNKNKAKEKDAKR